MAAWLFGLTSDNRAKEKGDTPLSVSPFSGGGEKIRYLLHAIITIRQTPCNQENPEFALRNPLK
jgi:hypothetical protein